MQCEHCKKRKATVFYKENISGRKKEYQLCAPCATSLQKAGELEDMSILLESFISPLSWSGEEGDLFSWAGQPTVTSPVGGRVCPSCGSTPESIRTTGKVGCQTCYTVFAEELTPLLRGVHGSATHVGRTPQTYRQRKEKQERIRGLRARLASAVAAEAYEQAAMLRDEIKLLEGGS